MTIHPPILLKGKPIADKNREYCIRVINEKGITPHLVVILCSNDPASEYYVQSIEKQSQKYNVRLTIQRHETITQGALINAITALNNDPTVHGIMVQKPLPKGIDASTIEQSIVPSKDIDGFHPLNAGLLLLEKDCFLPCTAAAILEILDFYEINPEGKHTVIVGRSNVVGKPVANLLLHKAKNRNATITVCHSRTPDLAQFTSQADILIVAVGIANLIKPDMIKDGVVIIDAGINELAESARIVGDVDFEGCKEKCASITPVPGGVGSVTTSILFKQVVRVI